MMDMHTNQSELLMILLSALAGAVHVLAPDHWVPGSILAWQRGWRAPRIALFSVFALGFHVLLGFVIYFLMSDWIAAIDANRLFAFSIAFVAVVTLLRGFRFSRVKEVFNAGRNGVWGLFAVISILGPCESIIPVFVKAGHLGMGYLVPFCAFLFGTVATGTVLMLAGGAVWNRPYLLPRGLQLARHRAAVIPVVAGLALGFRFLLKIT
jgi:hypothetical protein